MFWLMTFALVVALVALAFFGAPLWLWTAAVAVALVFVFHASPFVLGFFLAVAIVMNVPTLRRNLSGVIMRIFKAKKIFPAISETERIALEAGTVWMDAELFSGKPNFTRALATSYPGTSDETQAFIDGPCRTLCDMIDDWALHRDGEFTPEVWDYLRRERFFGLIVSKEYGGHGFDAMSVSAIIQYLASRSFPLSVTVMIPNSLGPAELLQHDGTEEQRRYYLPKLATGEIIPSFALTEPTAGSDAGAMTSSGEVFRDADGTIKIRIDFRKRYISLATISSLLGLAFKLHDPENLLGRGERPGITCALIPIDTPGIRLGRRHDPLGIPFHNCPVEGENVVVGADTIIGGAAGAGEGWRMLMEALAAGRGVTLPSASVAHAKLAARYGGAYAMVRRQFGLPVGRFEGVEERLARIAGMTYMMDAARVVTCAGIDDGHKPAVVTALIKYNQTELARTLVNDAMDILAGAGISRGPSNLFANLYGGLPIPVTVEGSNILTRSMIVFGQGAIRCHPFAYAQMQAVAENDVAAFDRAFFGHVGHVVRNGARSFVLSITRGLSAPAPVSGPLASSWRRLAWASASFAFFADLAMLGLGASLKRRESLTGRFADVLSWMYLALATLRRHEAEGRRDEDVPLAKFAVEEAFARMQRGFDELLANFPGGGIGWILRTFVARWSRMNPLGAGLTDALGAAAAEAIRRPDGRRDRLTSGLHVPSNADEAARRLDLAFELGLAAEPVERKIRDAVKRRDLPKGRPTALVDAAVEANVISTDEATTLRDAITARQQAVQVDSFAVENFHESIPTPGLGERDEVVVGEG